MQALIGCQCALTEVAEMLRDTLIAMKAINKKTGELYNENTNTMELARRFLRRSAAAGYSSMTTRHNLRALSQSRSAAVTANSIAAYTDVVKRALRDIQKGAVRLSLEDVMNFDEMMLDLNCIVHGHFVVMSGVLGAGMNIW